LKSVSEISYIAGDARCWGVSWLAAPAASQAMQEDFAMTIQILFLTTQIQSWLNMRVARHLAAQAEKLAR
jgi:hypothetical protein